MPSLKMTFSKRALVAAMSCLAVGLSSGAWAQDQTRDPTRDPLKDPTGDHTPDRTRDQDRLQDPIYGSQLMTRQERMDYQAQMRTLKTEQEREAYRLAHHQRMQERAKVQGVTLPETPPNPRPGMGLGQGVGAGTGSGASSGSGSGSKK